MPLKPAYTSKFKKDIKTCKKRNYNLSQLKEVMSYLIDDIPLPVKYRDHILIGNFKGRRECHIAPDWLLIYKIDQENIIFERTGSHSDLF